MRLYSIAKIIVLAALAGGGAAMAVDRFAGGELSEGVPLRRTADMLHAVMAADRAAYATRVVERLQDKEKVMLADEHFEEKKALPLPSQMFRFGAEQVAAKGMTFSYALLSPWAINRGNMPRTEVEKAGLEQVAASGTPYYGEETLGGTAWFTAVYPDVAVSSACVSCHNDHADSPRKDFKVGDVMGGIVIRIAR